MNDAVQVRDLKKNFKVAKTGRGGPLAKLKQFIHPLHESLNAVDDISFAIRRGEKVAKEISSTAFKDSCRGCMNCLSFAKGPPLPVFATLKFFFRSLTCTASFIRNHAS